jgi:hypothetical protein
MVSNKSLLESSKLQAMTSRDFQQLQRDLEQAMSKLKKANEPNAR